MSDKKKILIPAFAVLVFVTAFILYSPNNLLPRTMKTAEINSIGLHLAEDENTIFLVGINIENPSNIPVTITDIEIKILVNETDYNSMTLKNVPITINAEQTQSITQMVQLTGSPIGYQPSETRKRYILDITAEITGQAKSLGLEASRTVTINRIMPWHYDIS